MPTARSDNLPHDPWPTEKSSPSSLDKPSTSTIHSRPKSPSNKSSPSPLTPTGLIASSDFQDGRPVTVPEANFTKLNPHSGASTNIHKKWWKKRPGFIRKKGQAQGGPSVAAQRTVEGKAIQLNPQASVTGYQSVPICHDPLLSINDHHSITHTDATIHHRLKHASPPTLSSTDKDPSVTPTNTIHRKFVLLGDEGCGKKSLCHSFGSKPRSCNDDSLYNTQYTDVEVDGNHICLALWIPPLSRLETSDIKYNTPDAVLVCFAIDSPESLFSVKNRWTPVIRTNYPRVPRLLVGCKKDLRNDAETIEKLRCPKSDGPFQQWHPVTTSQGESFCNSLCASNSLYASTYLECSAKTHKGVREVLEHAVRATIEPEPKPPEPINPEPRKYDFLPPLSIKSFWLVCSLSLLYALFISYAFLSIS